MQPNEVRMPADRSRRVPMCPIIQASVGFASCQGEKCAWWVDGKCAIALIAKRLEKVG